MKLLLHACCAPCSLEPVRLLAQAGHEITLAYYNPNIHPTDEYEHRLKVLETWAEQENIEVMNFEYDLAAWNSSVREIAESPAAAREDRCRACYRMRLEKIACAANETDFDAIGTTLTVSPYQFTQIIEEELQRASQAHDLHMVFEDYRPYYQEATKRSRDLGMYRQNYCGCRYSMVEAEQERQQRKEQRKREKEERRRAKEQGHSHEN